MVKVMMSVCVDSSLLLSPSASCVTCVGVFFFFFFFLHGCSSIKELAVEQFFLLHNCMTGASCSLAVMKRPICRVCFQHSKLVCLVLRLTWQIFGPWLIFTQRLILGTQFQFRFEYQVFPVLDCKKKAVSQPTKPAIYNLSSLYQMNSVILFFSFGVINSMSVWQEKRIIFLHIFIWFSMIS